MPPKGHAILSASSSDRWLHCPPSARLCETYEDKGSDYAAEGTDAHELCEYKLKRALGMDASDPTENLTWYNEEMEDCANGYAAYILEMVEAAKESCADPKVLIEQRVDFSRWVEQGFGTADCIIIADGTLRICDYKHGLGVLVDATDNPQMKCYALGALELFDEAKLKGNGKSVPALSVIKTPPRDGDMERPDDPAYANAYFVNANATSAPGIVDADRNPILTRSEVYSGVYGRASISFYAFNSSGNKGIACGLNNLQKIRDGEPLGGKASAESDFASDEDDDFLN